MNQSRTEVDSSRRSAWAFTRLRLKGYPQYLRMRRRSNLSTFSFCANTFYYNLNNKIYEEIFAFYSNDAHANAGKCRCR